MLKHGRTQFVICFLAPAVLLYAVFVVVPLLQTFQYSVFDWRGFSMNKTFAGMKNFNWAINSSEYHTSLKNTVWLMVVAGSAMLSLALSLALAIHNSGKSARMMRGIFLFPHIVSLVVVALLWKFLLHPSIGLANLSLRGLGLGHLETAWLGNKATALPSVGLAFIWWGIGFYIMLFLAGITSIPGEVNEAANLDGAKGWRKFRAVTWPLLWSVKRVAITYVIIHVVNVFALVELMTQGGQPDRATEVTLTYLYEAGIQASKYGRGSAMAVINFALIMAITGLVLWLFRRSPEESRA